MSEKTLIRTAAAALCAAALAAYSHSFAGPFVFDDIASIPANPTIRRLWPLSGVLRPPATGITVTGRPLLNLSFAANYAAGGLRVEGYHLVNLVIHVLATLFLFGLVRRTVARSGGTPASATGIAFGAAALWGLHPLQTESVAYVVQRAESLAGLLYLLCLYAFVRFCSTGARARLGWGVIAIAACWAGMAVKEIMATAPLAVLAYDRTFVSGDFRDAWRRHGRVHAALAASWLLLAALLTGSATRGGTAGLGFGLAGSWTYLRWQGVAVAHYLRLAAWPSTLILDYGTDWVHAPAHGAICAAAVGLLLAASIVAFARGSVVQPVDRMPPPVSARAIALAGFCGLSFFLLLAPSSSVIPVATEAMAEHRMYLALAPLTVLLAAALWRLWAARALFLIVPLAAALGGRTVERIGDYHTAVALWSANVAATPQNPFARNNLGAALFEAGDVPGAVAQYRRSLELDPDVAKTHNNLGRALTRAGRLPEAAAEFSAAVARDPRWAEPHNNLGAVLAAEGRLAEARVQFSTAVGLEPGYAEAAANLRRSGGAP